METKKYLCLIFRDDLIHKYFEHECVNYAQAVEKSWDWISDFHDEDEHDRFATRVHEIED